jgi:putative membrane protein
MKHRLYILFIGSMAGCLAMACNVESTGNKRIAEEGGNANAIIVSDWQDPKMVANLAELEYGVLEWSKAASKQSQNKAVQQTAGMLQQDHALLLKQLQQYAANRNISMPGEATAADDRTLASMVNNKKPAGFDKEWCVNMLNRQEKVIAAMEDDATVAVDTNLRTWINDVLPRVRMHRDRLMQIKYTIR